MLKYIFTRSQLAIFFVFIFNLLLPAQDTGSDILVDTSPMDVSEDTSLVSSTGELILSWNAVSGAHHYQVEWTWVDSYSSDLSNIELSPESISFTESDFAHNNTRIETNLLEYSIPLSYGQGYVLYRVRGLGYFSEDQLSYKHTLWSTYSATPKQFISDWLLFTGYQITPSTASHRNLNWQFQSSYAEQGKKKEVVSYFDGSLRNRQTVTKINSDNHVVVGEVIYDAQGRPAVEVLPVPISSNKLEYQHDFTLNNQSTPEVYNYQDFDLDHSNVLDVKSDGKAMSNSHGASKYYSSNNTLNSVHRDYIADAELHPFSQIEYTSDNTGRIKRKSGVGLTHQLGGGKEMEYYYGTPTQKELNRLFGYSVGHNFHYKKNLVIDPNDQSSVSYIDPQGRTIATALVGSAPSNLEGLEDEQATNRLHESVTDVLFDSRTSQLNSNKLASSGAYGNKPDQIHFDASKLSIADNENYTFTYKVFPIPDFDYECYQGITPEYDVVLEARDRDQKLLFRSTESFTGTSGLTIEQSEVLIPRGSFSLSKTLKINSDKLEQAADAYIASLQDSSNSDCFVDNSASFFLPEILQEGCFTSCEECQEALFGLDNNGVQITNQGVALANYVNSLMSNYDFTEETNLTPAEQAAETTRLRQLFESQFQSILRLCNAPCDTPLGSESISCKNIKDDLLEDMKPYGQYGFGTSSITSLVLSDVSSQVLNIYNTDNALYSARSDQSEVFNSWRNPSHPDLDTASYRPALHTTGHYYNADQSISYVDVKVIRTIEFDDQEDSEEGSTDVLETEIITFDPPILDDLFTISDLEGKTRVQVEPHQLLRLDDFISEGIWQDSWAESLIKYHPEYAYLEYSEQECDRISNVGGTQMNSDAFDLFLNSTSSYQEAVSLNLLSDVGVSISGGDFLKIASQDPYFSTSPDFDSDNNRLKIMEEALTGNFDGSGVSMLSYVLGITTCNSISPCSAFNASSASQLTEVEILSALSDEPLETRNRFWNIYKSNYLALKQRIQTAFANIYAFNNDAYNGCIDNMPRPTAITDIIIDYSEATLNAIASTFNANNPSICLDPHRELYAEKTKRYIPADGSYNSSLDAEEVLEQIKRETKYDYYVNTGTCPLGLDMELFLNYYFKETAADLVTKIPAVRDIAYTGQYLSVDLFNELGGNRLESQASDFNIKGEAVSSQSLQITMTDGTSVLSDLPTELKLLNLSGPVRGITWNNYNSTWVINEMTRFYYTNYNADTRLFNFEVLARIKLLGTDSYEEVVLKGSTPARVGACSINRANGIGEFLLEGPGNSGEAHCTIESDFNISMTALINHLLATNTINSSSLDLSNIAAYSQGYLSTFLGSTEAQWHANGSTYTVSILGDTVLTLALDGVLNNIPRIRSFSSAYLKRADDAIIAQNIVINYGRRRSGRSQKIRGNLTVDGTRLVNMLCCGNINESSITNITPPSTPTEDLAYCEGIDTEMRLRWATEMHALLEAIESYDAQQDADATSDKEPVQLIKFPEWTPWLQEFYTRQQIYFADRLHTQKVTSNGQTMGIDRNIPYVFDLREDNKEVYFHRNHILFSNLVYFQSHPKYVEGLVNGKIERGYGVPTLCFYDSPSSIWGYTNLRGSSVDLQISFLCGLSNIQSDNVRIISSSSEFYSGLKQQVLSDKDKEEGFEIEIKKLLNSYYTSDAANRLDNYKEALNAFADDSRPSDYDFLGKLDGTPYGRRNVRNVEYELDDVSKEHYTPNYINLLVPRFDPFLLGTRATFIKRNGNIVDDIGLRFVLSNKAAILREEIEKLINFDRDLVKEITDVDIIAAGDVRATINRGKQAIIFNVDYIEKETNAKKRINNMALYFYSISSSNGELISRHAGEAPLSAKIFFLADILDSENKIVTNTLNNIERHKSIPSYNRLFGPPPYYSGSDYWAPINMGGGSNEFSPSNEDISDVQANINNTRDCNQEEDLCIPQPIQPVSCTDKYVSYTRLYESLNLELSEEIISKESFCASNLSYIVDDYAYYLQTMGVLSSDYQDKSNHLYYVSIGRFGATPFNYGYKGPEGSRGMRDIIDAYKHKIDTHENASIDSAPTWGSFAVSYFNGNEEALVGITCPSVILPPTDLDDIDIPVSSQSECDQFKESIQRAYQRENYTSFLTQKREAFINHYLDTALKGLQETLSSRYFDKEYQYTLYYYDQAGNLQQTVPPEGVNRFTEEALESSGLNSQINAYRAASSTATQAENSSLLPQHSLQTKYKYNTLNQLVWQYTPDGGITTFAYDELGRIVASQNAKQSNNKRPALRCGEDKREDNISFRVQNRLQINALKEIEVDQDVNPTEELTMGVFRTVLSPDGYIEYSQTRDYVERYTDTIPGTLEPITRVRASKQLFLGLSLKPTILKRDDIDYAMLSDETSHQVLYNSDAVLALQDTAPVVLQNREDRIRIERVNDHIYYYVNGDLIAQQDEKNTTKSKDLQIAVFYERGKDKLYNVVIGNHTVTPNCEEVSDFSYTLYDALGRIVEAGELTPNSELAINGTTGRLEHKTKTSAVNYVATNIENSFPRNISNQQREVSKTTYTAPIANASQIFNNFDAASYEQNVRNRVSAIYYFNQYEKGSPLSSYDNAIYYNYDIHGNVQEIACHNKALNTDPSNFFSGVKHVNYQYDLISGNVNKVTYQLGAQDQFIHKYTYDADNRITSVLTSRDGDNWETDAHYQYYAHGPLARVLLGDQKVQAIDYAYTLQGWLKGVNGDTNGQDLGNDGSANSDVAQDAFGYSLSYYNNDYLAISGASPFSASSTTATTNDLYNGNIKGMSTHLLDLEETSLGTLSNQYKYDQLNRIKSFTGTVEAGPKPERYSANYSYDRNGNLSGLTRRVGATQFDSLIYHYNTRTVGNKTIKQNNQLQLVEDPQGSTPYINDLLNQKEALKALNIDQDKHPTHNYIYDAIGQLVEDRTEGLKISWRVDGKVKKISKGHHTASTSDDQEITFYYDGLGNRLGKRTKQNNAVIDQTYYARDAQGNVMAVYGHAELETEAGAPEIATNLSLSSIPSNTNTIVALNNITSTATVASGQTVNLKAGNSIVLKPGATLSQGSNVSLTIAEQEQIEQEVLFSKEVALEEHHIYGSSRLGLLKNKVSANANQPANYIAGNKSYELSNHLGNVLSVITNQRLDNNKPDVIAFNDYYPFGMLLPNRHGSSDKYRYGFNGMEKDDELKGEGNSYDFGARMLDPRIGRWFAVDPLWKKYQYISPYSFAGNSPVQTIDIGGEKLIKIVIKDKSGYIQGDIELVVDEQIKDKVFKLLDYVIANKIKIHFNSDFRASSKQKEIQKTGTTPAKVGTSRHEAGFALDFNLYTNKGNIIKGNKSVTSDNAFIKGAKKLGFRWGGEFSSPDRIHIDAWTKNKTNIYGYKDFAEAYVENQGQTDIETVVYEFNRKDSNTDNNLKTAGTEEGSLFSKLMTYILGSSTKDAQVEANVATTSATNYTSSIVNTRTSGLKFYGASNSKKKLSLLDKGSLIFATGKTENGRAEVFKIDGSKGWVSKRYIKKLGNAKK